MPLSAGFNLYYYTDEGCIRSEDLSSALSAVGYIVSPWDLVTVCKHLNIRKNTEVDFRLFTAVIAHQIMSCTENQIINAFRLFDKEGRGSIGRFQWHLYFEHYLIKHYF